LAEGHAFRSQYDEALKYLEQAQQRRDRLSPIGRLDVDACEAWILHRHEEAAIAYREIVRMSPGDVFAKYLLAQYLMRANHPRETVQLLTQPVRWEVVLSRTSPINGITYFGMMTEALDLLGDHERELAEARRGRAMYPDLMAMRAYEASALAALGRFDELETTIGESLSQQLSMGTAGNVMLAAAMELRAHGHADESRAMARRAVAWYDELPDDSDPKKKSFAYAGSLEYADAWDEASKLYEFLAVKYAGTLLEFQARGMLGVIAAVQGDRESALKISADLARLRRPYLFGVDSYFRALIAARLGDKDQAAVLLQNTISEGFAGVYLPFTEAFECAWPLDTLRGYPPYEELVRPKG
jgi:tetratricopeptide (TPR) repeat protein